MGHPALDLDGTLQALAHPTRRALLQQLSAGEARVTDLAEPFAVSLKSISIHIRALEEAGLVRRRKVGREYLISIDTAPLESAALWLTQTAALWKYRLNRLSSLLSEEDEKPRSPTVAGPRRKPRRIER
jgi:DNA-binding transcriptional ArsR family regulator